MRIGLNKKTTSSEITGEVAFIFPQSIAEPSQESFCFSVGVIYPIKNTNVSDSEIQSQEEKNEKNALEGLTFVDQI